MENRDKQFEYGLDGPNEKYESAGYRNERKNPIAGTASEEQRGDELHGHENFGAEKDDHFDGGFPGAGDEKQNAAGGEGGDQDQPKTSEEAESESGAARLHMETWLDFGFESLEVTMNAAGVHAAEFAVDAIEVGKKNQADGEGQDADGVEENWHALEQSQFAAQKSFAAIHLALICFVIVAHQVQNSMKYQDAHFDSEGATEAAGIFAGDGGSDGDVAEVRIIRAARSYGAAGAFFRSPRWDFDWKR